jgi:hypothetical protein
MELIEDCVQWQVLVLVMQNLWVLIIWELNSKMVLTEIHCENATQDNCFGINGLEPLRSGIWELDNNVL